METRKITITTEKGKALLAELKRCVDGLYPLGVFLEEFEEDVQWAHSVLDDDEAEILDEAVYLLSLYEPDKKIYEAEKRQGVLNDEKTIKALKKLLRNVVVE